MREHLSLGSTPPAEECVQVGRDNYEELATTECNRYIALLREHCGLEPAGASLEIKGNGHDYGTYLEVAVYFDTDNEAAVEYAYQLENDGPETWTGEDYE